MRRLFIIPLCSIVICAGCATKGVLSSEALRGLEAEVTALPLPTDGDVSYAVEQIARPALARKELGKVRTSNWRGSFQKASSALCAAATRKGLEVESLRKCLDQLLAKSGEVARLPVGAFWRPRDGESGVWVIAFRWEVAEIRDEHDRVVKSTIMGHEGAVAFDSATLEIVGSCSCM